MQRAKKVVSTNRNTNFTFFGPKSRPGPSPMPRSRGETGTPIKPCNLGPAPRSSILAGSHLLESEHSSRFKLSRSLVNIDKFLAMFESQITRKLSTLIWPWTLAIRKSYVRDARGLQDLAMGWKPSSFERIGLWPTTLLVETVIFIQAMVLNTKENIDTTTLYKFTIRTKGAIDIDIGIYKLIDSWWEN